MSMAQNNNASLVSTGILCRVANGRGGITNNNGVSTDLSEPDFSLNFTNLLERLENPGHLRVMLYPHSQSIVPGLQVV